LKLAGSSAQPLRRGANPQWGEPMNPSLCALTGKANNHRSTQRLILVVGPLAVSLLLSGMALSQAGRRSEASISGGGVLINVVAKREDKSGTPISSKQLAVFDNGSQQDIKNLSRDPSPARLVLLVDNSLTIRADVEKLEEAAREFAYEIFDGDKLLIVGYDEQAEIVADWTDNAKAIETALKGFRKKGEPCAALASGSDTLAFAPGLPAVGATEFQFHAR